MKISLSYRCTRIYEAFRHSVRLCFIFPEHRVERRHQVPAHWGRNSQQCVPPAWTVQRNEWKRQSHKTKRHSAGSSNALLSRAPLRLVTTHSSHIHCTGLPSRPRYPPLIGTSPLHWNTRFGVGLARGTIYFFSGRGLRLLRLV